MPFVEKLIKALQKTSLKSFEVLELLAECVQLSKKNEDQLPKEERNVIPDSERILSSILSWFGVTCAKSNVPLLEFAHTCQSMANLCIFVGKKSIIDEEIAPSFERYRRFSTAKSLGIWTSSHLKICWNA